MHCDGGEGSPPPSMPIVIPFGVLPFESAAAPGAGFMFPLAARTKSIGPLAPGEMLCRRLPRSMCPSRPSSVGTQTPLSGVS